MRSVSVDVLVIGGGSAGLMAAISAHRLGAHTLLVDKGLVGKSGSSTGAAQLAAVGDWKEDDDSPDLHFRDTVVAGRYLNDQSLVRIMVEEAGPRVAELVEQGINFDRRPDGKYVLGPVAGHGHARSLCRHDTVGLAVCNTLLRTAARQQIATLSDVLVTDLLIASGRAYGAYGVDLRAGEPVLVEARTTVLTAGGAGRLYPVTTNPDQSTGDGYALALRAGVPLVDMEFYQFYPCCLVYPPALAGLGLSIIEVAKLYNANGERFMQRYNPATAERATRDLLSQSIHAEVLAGRGSPHGGVFMDATGLSDEVYRTYEYDYRMCLENGIDLRRECAEIAPGAHYVMGGAVRNAWAETVVDGLFVAGEAAGGLQGANRLGNNSIPECLVFGARAGERAARLAQGRPDVSAPATRVDDARRRVADVLERTGPVNRPLDVHLRLTQVMGELVGVRRSQAGLDEATHVLSTMADEHRYQTRICTNRLTFNADLVDYFEVDNMLLTAGAMVAAAQARRESRGAHFVEEWPTMDDAWLRHVVVAHNSDGFVVAHTDVDLAELRPGSGVPVPVADAGL